MSTAVTIASPDAAAPWWRASFALAWVAGVLLQLQQSALWTSPAYPLVGVAALLTLLAARRCRRRAVARVGIGLAFAAAGFAYAGWRADTRLADALSPAWEGCDVELVGVIDEMPQVAEDGERFAFVVESARAAGMTARELKWVASLDAASGQPLEATVAETEATAGRARASADLGDDDDDVEAASAAPPAPGAGTPVVPTRVWLAWSRNQRDDRAVAASPAPLRAGQRWRLPVRLRRPHGALNPDGFDAELWLFDQRLRATGTVRGYGQLLGTSWAPIENARQWIRDRLMLSGRDGDAATTGALAALTVGDQAAIDGPGWEVFRNTGVAHLMSISGLHITMLGWLGGAAIGALWRRSERAALWLATPLAARWGGVGVAWGYALLAGWGVPAQRTVLMLAATATLRSLGLNWPATLVTLAAMVPVTLLDPWALLQPGFWLSFAAVGLLMASEPARRVVHEPATARSRGDADAVEPAQTCVNTRDAGASRVREGAGANAHVGIGSDAAVGGSAGSGVGSAAADPAAATAGAGARSGSGSGSGSGGSFGGRAESGTGTGTGAGAGVGVGVGVGEAADFGVDVDVGVSTGTAVCTSDGAPSARTARLVERARALGTALANQLRGGFRAQLVASIGLAPLTLVAFQQVSLVGLLSNLVAEPWVTLVVTPLALLGIALPASWHLAALALKPLLWFLAWLARWPLASVHVATAPGWALVAGLAGGALLMLPLPWRVRLLSGTLLMPLLWPFVPRPPPGRFELVAADVGQGTAVLVRTHAHLLLFDTGPRFGDTNDAGRRVLLPLMQARGEGRVDVLMLSHADADHVGGAQSLIDHMPVDAMRSSLAAGNPLRANPVPHIACVAGQGWTWDGVRFAILHPFASDYRPGAKTNALSCVLRVVGADGDSALLTGDVEAPGEARLVARARAGPGDPAVTLRSDILVVPHHGSRTSSTDAFLDAVRPGVAVIQVGYRSRYGHPAPDVVARYRAHGIPVVRSDHCGAWLWTAGQALCTRAVRRRYWQWQGAPNTLTPAEPRSSATLPDP